MNQVLRLWCVASKSANPATRAEHEFVTRVRELASRAELVARFADSPEYVRSFAFDAGPYAWEPGSPVELAELHTRISDAADRREVLWLASPLRIANFVASTLALDAERAARLAPRTFTLTVVDHTKPQGSQRRPSLVGFELDWLPLEPTGSGGFPGATARK